MEMWLKAAGMALLGYILGSIPFGLLIVKLGTGKDIRTVASGRTGGTNAFRAAGLVAGLFTAALDILKGAASVWIAKAIFPGDVWTHIMAPLGSILGHNYSLFLLERDEKGKLRFRGGAGGAPCTGGALGLWPPSVLIIAGIGALVWYFIGYASVTTMSIGLVTLTIFVLRYFNPGDPWQYILYGVIAEIFLLWSLRPNIQRLIQGNERLVGWRANRKKAKQS